MNITKPHMKGFFVGLIFCAFMSFLLRDQLFDLFGKGHRPPPTNLFYTYELDARKLFAICTSENFQRLGFLADLDWGSRPPHTGFKTNVITRDGIVPDTTGLLKASGPLVNLGPRFYDAEKFNLTNEPLPGNQRPRQLRELLAFVTDRECVSFRLEPRDYAEIDAHWEGYIYYRIVPIRSDGSSLEDTSNPALRLNPCPPGRPH